MPLKFVCKDCGKNFMVDDTWAGKRAKCKGCGNIVQLPTVKQASPPPIPVRQNRVVVDEQPAKAADEPIPPIVIKLIAGILLIGIVVCAWVIFGNRAPKAADDNGFVTRAPGANPPEASPPDSPVAGAAPPVQQIQFPERPVNARVTINGADVYPLTITGTGPGIPMQIRLYLPHGRHELHSLPCVFIAPAGTRGLHGSTLGNDDMAEHLPYAQFGFAVVAYELSGDVPGDTGRGISFARLRDPVRQFMAADGGLANARAAIDFALTKLPEVDPDQLFAAGHSSAATMALNLVESDHRFRAVAAYAPATDEFQRWGADLATIDRLVPGAASLAERVSPIRHVNQIACPVLIFHADDDTNVLSQDINTYVSALQSAGKSVQLVTVPTGGHYQSMIEHGIPAGISFFLAQGAKPQRPILQ